jgi:hypothetical protein
MLTIEHNQQFQWKIVGQGVPMLYAKLSGTLRDRKGVVVQELDDSHFTIDSFEEGLFSLNSDKLSPEATTFQIYGQLPNCNRVIITKGILPVVS